MGRITYDFLARGRVQTPSHNNPVTICSVTGSVSAPPEATDEEIQQTVIETLTELGFLDALQEPVDVTVYEPEN